EPDAGAAADHDDDLAVQFRSTLRHAHQCRGPGSVRAGIPSAAATARSPRSPTRTATAGSCRRSPTAYPVVDLRPQWTNSAELPADADRLGAPVGLEEHAGEVLARRRDDDLAVVVFGAGGEGPGRIAFTGVEPLRALRGEQLVAGAAQRDDR